MKLVYTIAGLALSTLVGIQPASAFVIDLWESIDNTPNGTPTETGPWIALPSVVTNGYVVVLEEPQGGQSESNWSDVVEWQTIDFFQQPTSIVRLLSDDELVTGGFGNPLWPNLDTVLSGPHAFVFEDATGLALYDAGDNQYYVHSDAEVPEPTMLGLAGTIGLLALRRKPRA